MTDTTKPIGSTTKDPMYDKRTTMPDTDPMERGDAKAPPQVKPAEKFKGGRPQ